MAGTSSGAARKNKRGFASAGLVVEHQLHGARRVRHEQHLEPPAWHGVPRCDLGVADPHGDRHAGRRRQRERALGRGDELEVPAQGRMASPTVRRRASTSLRSIRSSNAASWSGYATSRKPNGSTRIRAGDLRWRGPWASSPWRRSATDWRPNCALPPPSSACATCPSCRTRTSARCSTGRGAGRRRRRWCASAMRSTASTSPRRIPVSTTPACWSIASIPRSRGSRG